MKIYFAHTKDSDYKNDLYIPIRNSELNREHDIVLPHEHGKNEYSKPIIESSDLLIAEVSYPATGSGIEIGWGNAAGVPLLCVHKTGTKPSGSLRFLTEDFIEYVDTADLVLKLTYYLNR